MNDQELQRELRQALDERLAGLDGATLSRLNRARQRALEGAGSGAVRRARGWLPAGAVAGVALLLAVGTWMRSADGPSPAGLSPGELEIATLDADLELVEELEFYDWLESTGGKDRA